MSVKTKETFIIKRAENEFVIGACLHKLQYLLRHISSACILVFAERKSLSER